MRPESVGLPGLADLESKYAEFAQMRNASKSDWSMPNAKKKAMAIEHRTLTEELAAARKEATEEKNKTL